VDALPVAALPENALPVAALPVNALPVDALPANASAVGVEGMNQAGIQSLLAQLMVSARTLTQSLVALTESHAALEQTHQIQAERIAILQGEPDMKAPASVVELK
jgi:hypothetical protein